MACMAFQRSQNARNVLIFPFIISVRNYHHPLYSGETEALRGGEIIYPRIYNQQVAKQGLKPNFNPFVFSKL
jgi:hypothetical protein